jgi:hypothetical protein
MAILYGTTGDGTTLPVLVDQFGNLLAKGIDGQPGAPGPPGPSGGAFPLPPGATDGALLGWQNGDLVWITDPFPPVVTSGFKPIIYTGNGGTQSITGVGFSSGLVWIKNRTGNIDHNLYDVIRGVNKPLITNNTAPEDSTNIYGAVSAFDSDGFTVQGGSTDATRANAISVPYVAWCWDAGDTTVTNKNGSIESQVRANLSAGFSIVKWNNGGGGVQNVGHGLSAPPAFWIFKPIDTSGSWFVYHKSIGTGKYLRLERLDKEAGTLTYWTPTATTMNVATNIVVGTSSNMIAYCWAETPGVSSFGEFPGQGGSPFTVTTGFRPAFLMVKSANTAGGWVIVDSARSPSNPVETMLEANTSNAKSSGVDRFNFTDTGFEVIAASDRDPNVSGREYIYAAFA